MIATVSSLIPVLISQAEAISQAFVMVLDGLQALLEKPITLGIISINLEPLLPPMEGLFSQLTQPLLEDALQVLEATSKNTLYFLLIVVGTYYLMVDWSDLREWALHLAPESARHDMRRLYWEIRAVWMAYLRGQIVLMLVVGIVFTVIYIFIGLPGAIVVGMLTGLLTLIPDLGPFIGTVVAVIVALLEGSSILPLTNVWFAVTIAAIYAVLMIIKNIWLRPFIMGRAVQMHEGLVFVAIIAAVIFSGILGALIVVPVMASLGVIGAYARRRLLGLPAFPGTHVLAGESAEPMPEQEKMHPKKKPKK
jgi:predicted PurR-regulated permease PerM